MAMRARTVRVKFELVDHDHDHWCNRCLLSTGIQVWVVVRFGGRMHLQTKTWCTECGSHDITVDPDGRHC